MNRILTSKWAKVFVFALCLVPLAIIIGEGPSGWGANPTQFLEHATGDWILRFLAITLAVSPLRKIKILGLTQLIRFRRMLGLFAFFYAFLHFSLYLGLDQVLDFHGVWADIAKRPYITVGFTGFVLMIPLAITSTAGMVRRMGYRRWQVLHRVIYISAVAGVIHFYWLVKSDVHLPLLYAAIMAVLLGWRLFDWFSDRGRGPARGAPARKEPTTVAAS
jgi:methionine sulfoxide reductase heme-binding subunit